jgi:hypothetical protein
MPRTKITDQQYKVYMKLRTSGLNRKRLVKVAYAREEKVI